MVDFIDQVRDSYGIESICQVLPIAPSTYFRTKQLLRNPEWRCERARNDEALKPDIIRVHEDDRCVYGARKVWKQLRRESVDVARCTVERLMAAMGLQGVRRGKSCITTITDDQAARPLDLVNRQFTADRPNQLWVADITYVAKWSGGVYVAFVIDVFSRYIVGWRVLKSLKTNIVLDELEQALWPVASHEASHIIATGAANTSRGWLKQASTHRWAALETPTTTRWPKQSMVYTKVKSFTKKAHGKALKRSNMPR
jgi:hypothetical protein